MDVVKVLAPRGASVAGAARVKLTKAQWARRAALLGSWKKGGVFALDGGATLTFKEGEVFGIDTPQKLNRDLFELPEEKAIGDDTVSAGGDDTVSGSSGDATGSVGGDDTLPGGGGDE